MEEGDKSLNKEQQKLVSDNHNLIYSLAHKMNLELEEYYDLLAIGLCKAALTYKESKGKFSTYAFTCMRNEVSMYWRTFQTNRMIPKELLYSLDTPIDDEHRETNWRIDEALYGEYRIDISRSEIEEFIKSLNDRDRFILIKLLNGYTQVSIAEELKCSQSYINHLIKKIRQKWSDERYKK